LPFVHGHSVLNTTVLSQLPEAYSPVQKFEVSKPSFFPKVTLNQLKEKYILMLMNKSVLQFPQKAAQLFSTLIINVSS